MVHQVHPYFNPAQTDAFNVLASATDSTFEVRYFKLHGMGGNARTILSLAGAKFTNADYENDWDVQRPLTPFGLMPVLTETSADGKTKLQIAESDAIERYLSRKFGLLGGNAFEEVLVNTFVSNSQALVLQIFAKIAVVEDLQVRAANLGLLIKDHISPWIRYHEQHLQANGANGHYVGNKTTLADVKADYLIGMIQGVTGEDLVSQTKTPALWKVREELTKYPGLAAWRASRTYKEISDENLAVLGY